jgi:LmbE family N-acetylglucosaminyl deacetylase
VVYRERLRQRALEIVTRAADILSSLRQLPIATLDTITNSGSVMVLAPHADDESLGCGGLIAELVAKARPPMIVILTDGTGSHPLSREYPAPRLRALREQEALKAVTILGVPADHLVFLHLRDTATPKSGPKFLSTVGTIESHMRRHEIDVLCAPWLYDPHGDHEAAQLIASAAAMRTGATLLSYPVWGWLLEDDTRLPAVPIVGWRLDIRDHLELKRRAIAAHASQYSDLIVDDPTGFRLPAELLSAFDSPYEVFLSRA